MINATKKKHIHIPDDDILYITTTLPPGKLRVVTKEDEVHLWDGIARLQEKLPHFIRPSAATLLNPEIIEFIDYKRQRVQTPEGEFKIARTRIAQLKEQVNDSDYKIPTSDDKRSDTDKRQQDDS